MHGKKAKVFYLQGYLYAWLGCGVIPGDPNNQNESGKLFHNYLTRHAQLSVVNSLPICRGLITRKRDLVNGRKEKSIIDFVVVCTHVLPYVTEMVIDESNQYITTNYTQVKNTAKAIDSDHNTEFVKMSLMVVPVKQPKREIYNLKNLQGQIKFKQITEKAPDFLTCLNSSDSIVTKSEIWKNCLDLHIKKAFRKVKIQINKAKPSASHALIDKRNKLKNDFGSAQEKKALDLQIAEILLKEEVEKASHFKKFCNSSSSFPLQQMWILKKKLWPKKKPSLPVAKRNHKGRLISSPKELLHTLQKEYKDRLRKRKVKSYLREHMVIMHEVTKLKLAKAWKNKSPCFTMEELEKGLKDLNRGKARDPHNLCAELFQIKVIGADLKLSLLQMLNEIKEQGVIPNIMRESTVTTIPKCGSKFDLKKRERHIQAKHFKKHITKTYLQ